MPWFVAWIHGEPDFRVADEEKLVRAIKHDLCWLCGATLGRHKVFVIGPMCAVNRNTAEPPCHRECAEYAVQACPFLTQPRMRRNTAERPAEALDPAGISIPRNPGVTLLWITRSYQVLRTSNGVLFRLAEPHELVAYAEGKITTRDALDASVASGLPILASMAAEQGEDAMQALLKQCDVAEKLFDRMLPARAAVA